MIRCAMFDFGNVLVHFDTQRFVNFLRAHSYRDDIKPEEVFKLECLAEFELGRIKTAEMFKRIKSALELNVGIGEFLFQYTDVMKPDPKMFTLRRMLRADGIKLAVVSNINQYHFNYVQFVHPEVFADFDNLTLSFQLEFKKPDRRMWEIPAFCLGVRPDECFFVDDLKANIDAFEQWGGGIGHYYNVIDEKYYPNDRLEVERSKLIFKMASLNMLSYSDASDILQVTF